MVWQDFLRYDTRPFHQSTSDSLGSLLARSDTFVGACQLSVSNHALQLKLKFVIVK